MSNLGKKIMLGASGVTAFQIALFVGALYVINLCSTNVFGLLVVGCYLSKLVLFTLLVPAWGVWNSLVNMNTGLAFTMAFLTIWAVNIVFTFALSGGILGTITLIKSVGKKYGPKRKNRLQ